MKRGKVLWEKDLETLIKKNGQWGRYQDTDGDGIPYRTIPGNLHEKAAYFTRGTGHDEFAHYSEENRDWENNLLRLKKKVESAKKLVPPAELVVEAKGRVGLIAYGSTKMSALEAVAMLNRSGRPVDFLRIKALPFTDEVETFLKAHDRIVVAEANRDGQMKQILCVNFPDCAAKLHSAARCDGLSLSAEWIVNQIEKMEG
jgi:Pyruvate:ferredoxin oxidoreductase and related 2-oxoacid:ferredoxin oxidoreductases, alpha subunit